VTRRLGLVVCAICAVALVSAGTVASVTRLPGFRSPSGNIKCFFSPGKPSVMRCMIAQADYARKLVHYCGSPPIQVDWAGFELGATRKGSVSCSGGVLYDPSTQRPTFTTLAYGKSWRHGVFTCWSRVSGVTCRNREGNGLFVSRRSWRAW
jgi:hypothetical protein